jgi:hypothetical protein
MLVVAAFVAALATADAAAVGAAQSLMIIFLGSRLEVSNETEPHARLQASYLATANPKNTVGTTVGASATPAGLQQSGGRSKC